MSVMMMCGSVFENFLFFSLSNKIVVDQRVSYTSAGTIHYIKHQGMGWWIWNVVYDVPSLIKRKEKKNRNPFSYLSFYRSTFSWLIIWLTGSFQNRWQAFISIRQNRSICFEIFYCRCNAVTPFRLQKYLLQHFAFAGTPLRYPPALEKSLFLFTDPMPH